MNWIHGCPFVVVLFYMRMCGVRAFFVLHGNALACLSHAWVCACVCHAHCGGVPMLRRVSMFSESNQWQTQKQSVNHFHPSPFPLSSLLAWPALHPL